MAGKKSGHGGSAGERQTLQDLRVHQIELERQNEELRRAQAELDAARARYFDLFDLAPVGYVTVSEEGLILEANLTAATLLGVARGELVRQRLSRFVLKEDQDSYYLHRKRLCETGEPQAYELRMVKEDDTRFWAHLEATAAQDSDGGPMCRVVMSDITEHKRAEEALRNSETRLGALVAQSPLSVQILDTTGKTIQVNRAFEELWGTSFEQTQNFNPLEDEQVDGLGLRPYLKRAFSGESVECPPVEYTPRAGAVVGRRRVVLAIAYPIKDESGAVREVTLIYQDITDRKRAEVALRESEERYRSLVESALDGIVIYVGDRIALANRAAAAMLGFAGPAELVGQPLASFVHPDDLASAEDRLHRVLAGEAVAYPVEVRYVKRDGTELPVENTGALVTYEGKAAILAVIRDITDRKRTEEALRESEARNLALISAFPDLLFTNRRDGEYLAVHTSHPELLFAPPETFLHRKCDEIMPKPLSDLFMRAFADALDLHAVQEFNYVLPIGGEEKNFETRVTPCTKDTVITIVRDVTARQRAEESLRESEARHRHLVESSNDWVWETDANAVLTFASANVVDLLGYTPEEVVGRSAYDLMPPGDAAKARAAFGPLVAQRKAFRGVENTNLHKNGRRVVLESNGVPVFDDSGAFRGYRGMDRDITERKRAEEALRKSEARYRRIAEGLTDYQYSVDIEDGRAVETTQTPACASVTGYTAEEYAADPYLWIQMVTPEDRERVREHARLILAGEDVPSIEHRIVRKDGEVRWVSDTAILLKDASGRLLSYDGVISDITERKRTEEALRASEERYHALFENSAVAIAMRSPDGGYLEFNGAYSEMLGYTREELLSRRTADVTHPADVEISRSNMAAVAEGRAASHRYEKRYLHKNGSVVWGDVCIRPLRDGDGNVVAIVGAVVDLTERKEAEEALRLRSSALNAAANAVVITDREGGIEWVNQAFLALTGYGEDEVIGRNPRVLLKSGAQDQAFYKDLWDTVFAGDVWHGELTNRRKDGSVYSEEMTITPLRDTRGEIRHFIAVKQDITKQKLLQAEFVQSQKMESVGRLAGGIAHDFNNLLSVINGYAELAVADRSLSSPLRAQIVAIHRAGERAATLTRQLLSFSRRQTVAPVVLDLNAAIRAVQKMLERLIGEDITLVFAPTEPLGRVRADPGQFEQVVMNLVINARDAMPAGGMLGIETANAELDREAAERVSAKPGSYVMLAISDIGMGMDEVTREHIFEPFFTTKGSSKGTGLGLAIVYGIVQQSGGGIQVTSTVGQGTTFSIYLPRVETPVGEEAATPPAPAEEVGGTETILVVEDDESLRTMAADVLASAGYTVLKARHGEEALQLLARHGEPVHLVFTDMVMPGMGGLELAKEIGKTHPQIKVLFTSGFASDPTAGRVAPEELTHFICKPYSVGQLARKVREVLDWLW